jgi:hypothetical protein
MTGRLFGSPSLLGATCDLSQGAGFCGQPWSGLALTAAAPAQWEEGVGQIEVSGLGTEAVTSNRRRK